MSRRSGSGPRVRPGRRATFSWRSAGASRTSTGARLAPRAPQAGPRAGAAPGVRRWTRSCCRATVRTMIPFRVAFVLGRPRFVHGDENLERGLALARTVEADLVVL